MESNEAKRGGTPSQQGLYAKIASKSDEVIARLFELMNSRNLSVALGACNTLLDKLLPDLKSISADVSEAKPIKITVVGGGFTPPDLKYYDIETSAGTS